MSCSNARVNAIAAGLSMHHQPVGVELHEPVIVVQRQREQGVDAEDFSCAHNPKDTLGPGPRGAVAGQVVPATAESGVTRTRSSGGPEQQ